MVLKRLLCVCVCVGHSSALMAGSLCPLGVGHFEFLMHSARLLRVRSASYTMFLAPPTVAAAAAAP